MQPLFNEYKQKILSTAIVTIGAFLGFEILAYILERTYQLHIFTSVALYVYAFHFFWLTFLFDLQLKKRGVIANLSLDYKGWRLIVRAFRDRVQHVFKWSYLRHYLNFLILPGMIYWSVILLMSINPFNTDLIQSIIVLSTLAMAVIYWYLKDSLSKNFEMHYLGIKTLILVKVFSAFLVYSALVGYTFYFGLSVGFMFLAIFVATFLIIYQALFQHKLWNFNRLWPVLAISLLVGAVSFWIYQVWDYSYLMAALVLVSFYNTCWGILHHYLDNNLTRRLAAEYLLLLFVILSVLLAGHNFNPRIQ